MASKLQFYQSLSEQTASEATDSCTNWMNFLDTAARLYKYPFPDQLLIHAQRPDAIACASIETWNDNFNRWVVRGTKGIGLIDDSGNYPRLKYVFDINDTEAALYNSRPVYVWEMRQEHRELVLETLDKVYDDVGDTLADSFRNIARQMADEYYSDNAQEIRHRAEDSALFETNSNHLGIAFKNALTDSITYTLMVRCGLDTSEYFDIENFQYIFDFDTPDMIYALGTATNELSAQVLKDVELTIKKYERQKTAERSAENERSNNVHTGRGLSPAGHSVERTTEGINLTPGPVRTDAESISERASENHVQHHAVEGNPVPPSAGNRGSSQHTDGASDEPADREGNPSRQGERPHGLDGGDERLESPSGGIGTEPINLRGLNEPPEPPEVSNSPEPEPTQSSQAPPQTPSVRVIPQQDGVFDVNETLSQVGTRLSEHLSASSITLDEVDAILRDGANDFWGKNHSTLRITAHFSKGLSHEDNTAFLRREYLRGPHDRREDDPEGKGFQFGTTQTAVWWDASGITIGRGKSAHSATDYVILTWEQCAERVKALYDAGQYVTHDILDEALYNEDKNRSDDVIEMYKDLSRGISDIKWELSKHMTDAQKNTLINNPRHFYYLIKGLPELIKRTEAFLEGENKPTPDEVMAFYNEAIQLSQRVPPEWGFDKHHPDIDEHVTALLNDKGAFSEDEVIRGVGYSESSSFASILNQVRDDVATLRTMDKIPVRMWRNPYRVLADLEKAGMPPKGFPQTEINTVDFKRFITDDEIDSYLARNGANSDSRLRTLSYFLHDHTPAERVKFVKDSYGHGGGTWHDGWSNAEPGKGVVLKRANCEEVKLNWNQVTNRTRQLIESGKYITRADLDYIPDYERMILAREIMYFYQNLPKDEYPRPFSGDMYFHYPKDEDWASFLDFINDPEKIATTLEQMQYILTHTSEDDRYFKTRKEAYEQLSAFHNGTYTLFPGIEKLPDPELATNRRGLPMIQGTRPEPPTPKNAKTAEGQLTLFDMQSEPPPNLPTVDDQRRKIEQANTPAAEADAPAVLFSVTQDEIDGLLLIIGDSDKARIHEQFNNNPRSREAVKLVREIYGNIEKSLPRQNNADGDLWIIGGNAGVNIVGTLPSADFSTNEDAPHSLTLAWATVIKRVGELVTDGHFIVTEQAVEQVNEQINEQISEHANEQETEPVPEHSPGFVSTLYDEYMQVKAENPNDIVIFQIGDAHEIYNDDAVITSQLLEVPLILRERTGLDAPLNFVSITQAQLSDVVEKLYAAGHSITMSVINVDGNRSLINIPQENVPEILNEIVDEAPSEMTELPDEIIDAPVELDFDAVAKTIFARVMEDEAFSVAFNEARGRRELRKPLNIALDDVIDVHQKDEPHVYHAYYNDDDFNDKLFAVIYNGVWALRQQREAEAQVQAEPQVQADSEPHVQSEPQMQDDLVPPTEIEPHVGRSLHEQIRNELLERGISVSDEVIDFGISEFEASNGKGAFTDIADFIDNEVLFDEDELSEYFTPEDDTVGIEEQFPVAPDAASNPQPTAPPIPTGTNFRITDDQLGEGGAKTKFRNNLNAIHVLKDLELENRTVTLEEQETLSRYIGWGGLPQAFDPNNRQWTNEYLELNATLSPIEHESAKASTLNAHYTSPVVIKAMYEAIERMGFTTGNILEPSCGVGNFFGLLPESMNQSKLYGVELDSITARIAKHLYPQANIKETGYEKTNTPDAFFDLAIGNVPFGNYQVVDKRYDKHKFSIHDYFFAKTLDQVRPGGVIAFITSKYTLDKQDPTVRKYLAQRADLLGAVRLPNDAFLKNAGTETTMDILFLQKRDRPIDIEPNWVHLGFTNDAGGSEREIPINRYFIDNPEMILGKMALDEKMNNKYGRDNMTCCLPIEGADLAQQLKTALLYVQGTYTVAELDDLDGVDNNAIPADPSVKNFSYTVLENNGMVYFRENSLMYPVDLPVTTLERIRGMISLRDCVHHLIELQLDEHTSDEAIKAVQQNLSELYDQFSAEHGLINAPVNNRAFRADSAYYLLSSLEVLDVDGNLERKADMFTMRTIKQRVKITHVDTATEALAVSLDEHAYVNLEFMSELTGFSQEKLIADLKGVIYLNIGNAKDQRETYVTADEYLSGNIRKKLETAKAAAAVDPSCEHNVEALEKAMPKDLDATEISVRLGTTWIAPEYVQQFMHELLKTSYRNRETYQVRYHDFTGEWQVTAKGRALFNDIMATVTYGTSRMNAYQILDDTLNLRDVRIYDFITDTDGKEKRVLNKKETTLAQQKQEQMKTVFKDWIWKDPERRQTLVQLYNERFNSIRPREYDGSHITFVGINPEEELRKHQVNGIARGIYGGNTLLGHCVGAGKTWQIVAMAMEMKRLGLCNKSMIAVPNHLTEQWAGDFFRLYPSANILVATKKDFEIRNRKKFSAKIATGDYDAVIIGHTQLEKIPISRERQERHILEQIWEIETGISELKNAKGEQFTIKQLARTKKTLETRLTRLIESKKRDDVVTFEQLGVDRLFVDEAHSFKNLFLYTKMRNVAGVSTTEAQKSSDLFLKCRYLDELTGNKGVIFATGTPISNSMTELYTIQRYLQYDALVEKGLIHFDAWASIFGETVTSIELAPEGTGYRARTRFAQFHNLPELMAMFKEVADIQTADMLDLPVPDVKYENIIVEPSEVQKLMVKDLSERAAKVHAQLVDPKVDNMLKITTDGRKIGLDQRLINPLIEDFEGSKINAATNNVFRIWKETATTRKTQLVFCDFSTPNKDGRFNIYEDMRSKLLDKGIPEHEIAFIHDADSEARKKELFAKVRQGYIRVLFGSTVKMGSGTNVQDRLITTHDVDCPWRPADLEQRSGRIVRQGNQNPEVQIFRYATSGTFDSYLWQTVEKKQNFISQIISSKSPVRSCEDVDETALSYAEIKALCAGNPLIAEKMNLDIEVAKLRMLKADHQSQHFRLEDDLLKRFPEQIASVKERIAGIEKDVAHYKAETAKLVSAQQGIDGKMESATTAAFAGMTVQGVTYSEKEPAGKALLDICKTKFGSNESIIGEYMGFKMSLLGRDISSSSEGASSWKFQLLLRGNMTYQVELSSDTFGNITRINNALNDLPTRLEGAKAHLESVLEQQEAAKAELTKPFTLADKLVEKEARLALLNAELNIDGNGGMDVINDTDTRDHYSYTGAHGYEYDDEDEFDNDDEPTSSINIVNSGKAFDYPPRTERQSVPAKSTKPLMMDKIRAFNTNKPPSTTGKKTERDL